MNLDIFTNDFSQPAFVVQFKKTIAIHLSSKKFPEMGIMVWFATKCLYKSCSYTQWVLRRLISISSPPNIASVIKAIADDKALTLFNSIAILGEEEGCIPSIKEVNLTTKQYYSRIGGLMKADLIKKSKGRYSLTMFGKIVYSAHLSIGKVLNDYWKLKAIESIEASTLGQLPREEFTALIETLIDNKKLKNIILGRQVDNTIKSTNEPVISVESKS